ncbi:MAG TPA: hypothetical protein VK473_07450 [Terriglobales bacterium]|nr:hypothetical protein [Terriglobales bacterium]
MDKKRLETEAMCWACFFYTLRDGQPGSMQRVKWETASHEQLQRMNWYRFVNAHPEWKNRSKPRVARPVGPPIFIPVQGAAAALPEKMKVKEWAVFRPIAPKPEIWDQLTEAHTVEQIQKAARAIGQFRQHFASTMEEWAQHPDKAISHYVKGIITAKQLPHYPRTKRGRSDDKRLVFLAKVMAGLTLDLAPITAVKRLSRWSLPKDWADKAIRENVEQERLQFLNKGGIEP